MKTVSVLAAALLLLAVPAVLNADDISVKMKTYSDELSSLAGLEIITIPSGAKIYIDDAPAGTSDLETALPQPGLHRLRIEKPGYRIVEYSLRTRKNTAVELTAVLERLTGTVTLITEPAFAEAVAGELTFGQGSSVVPTGYYRISVSADGYLGRELGVRVYAGRETLVNAVLEKDPDFIPEGEGAEDSPAAGSGAPAFLNGLCASAGSIQPLSAPAGTLLLSTWAGISALYTPWSGGSGTSVPAGGSVYTVPVDNLEITAGVDVYSRTSVSGSSFTLFRGGVEYQIPLEDDFFSLAAAVSAGFTESGGWSIKAAVPAGLNFGAGELMISTMIAAGVRFSSHAADGTEAVAAPALSPDLGAGLALYSDTFAFSASALPVFNDFGSGFPAMEAFMAAAGVSIPMDGVPVIISVRAGADIMDIQRFEAGISTDFQIF